MNLEKVIQNKNKELQIKMDCEKAIKKEKEKQNKEIHKETMEMIQPLLDIFDKNNIKYEPQTGFVAFRCHFIKILVDNESGISPKHIFLGIECDSRKALPFNVNVFMQGHDSYKFTAFRELSDAVAFIAEKANEFNKRVSYRYTNNFDKLFI